MGLMRSERMKHGTLVLPVDRAREFIDLIGDKINMQFEDMNSRDMLRPYKKYIQRIDEMERILRFLMDEVGRMPGAHIVKDKLDDFLVHSNDYKLDDIESRLKRIHGDFVEFKENNSNLVSKRNAALEERYVVQAACAQQIDTALLIGRQQIGRTDADGDQFEFAATRHLLDDDGDRPTVGMRGTMFSNIAGVIPQSEQDRFARALFRATRGNTFTHFQHIPEPLTDPKSGKHVIKSVFVTYFQDHKVGGSGSSAMAERVRRIANIFGVNIYRWPSSSVVAAERRAGLQAQVDEEKELLRAHEGFTLDAAQALLDPPRRGANSLIEEWRLFCMKEKAIYASLNMFEGRMNLRANCWYPAAEEDQIRALLIQHSSKQSGSSSAMLVADRLPPKKTPPTYIRLNDFTLATQTLVNLYGMPRYQEANPVLFSIVTFPFLFGVMYGDVGHGLLLFVFGLYLVWKADNIKHISFLYQARYMVAMMGFFGTYAGLLYNDFFSVGMDLFGSRWSYRGDESAQMHEFEADYDTKNMGGPGPYPFGMDPVWHGASNELVMANSLKMKLSVVLGVSQMVVGLLLRFANAIHERNCIDFFCECIPMMIFMVCFFGFMDYMICYKWVTAMDTPPSIINSLIAMGMWGEDPAPMFGMGTPRLLMSLSMITVPWMLVIKPVILNQKMKRAKARGGGSGHAVATSPSGVNEEAPLSDCIEEAHDDEEHGIGEIVIHQVIETIEYVLGTVSHTASYLRLWALSLAHQQLSFVFFQKTILMGMSMPPVVNIIAIYILFAMWFGITLGVLMGMDVMECVLHVLRLHWIEFQSKFYKADGYLFAPYRHDVICKSDDDGF